MGLWQSGKGQDLNEVFAALNSSIGVDKRMFREDVLCSLAHAEMLAKCGIIGKEDGDLIKKGLNAIYDDVQEGRLKISEEAEDIHTFVEETLTARIGDAGKKLHTARSRNDQVAVDFRLYCLHFIKERLLPHIKDLANALLTVAERNTDTVMSGYTHLQKAQPITFAHQLAAYVAMLDRDYGRLSDATKRIAVSPLGSAAFAGTTYPIDRKMTAELIFGDGAEPCGNSIDGVSDRDFAMETASDLSILAVHLSRLAEELILWSSQDFGYVRMSDDFSTGSSIMPQKKNPDGAELIRGKTGRVIGNTAALFVMMKGLPLAYNKDMQEDKELLFDAFDTVDLCLRTAAPMIESMTVLRDNMRKAAELGYINATDLADYLVKKGMPFRDAYRLVKEAVAAAADKNVGLSELKLEELKALSPLFEEDVYAEIDLRACAMKRTSFGGTGKTEEYIEEAESKWKTR